MNQITRMKERGHSDSSSGTADYEADFLLWIESQVQLLRERKFAQLDLDNLVEEIDAMGRSQRRELRSRLEILLMHLLKCQYQPEQKSPNWLATLAEQRSEIAKLLADSPSLNKLVAAYAEEVFPSASHRAAIETGLPDSTFPTLNPFSKNDLSSTDFVP